MSDKWIRIQRDEVKDRTRQRREATMQEAQRQADARARRQAR